MGSYEPYTNDSPITTIGQNEAHWRLYRQGGLNKIRQLQDRAIDLSGDGGEWAEAYVDSNGQLNSVDTGSTSLFNTNKYIPGIDDEASSDTTYNPDSFSNPENAFDDDVSTYASTYGNEDLHASLGKTFSSKNVLLVAYKVFGSAATDVGYSIKLQTYDGSNWNDEYTIDVVYGSKTTSGVYVLNSSVQGVRLHFDSAQTSGNNPTFKVYYLQYGNMLSSSVITHNIPLGNFSSNISICFGTALVSEWEEGANIQYKLTNTTDDSGWLNINEVSEFTPFTSEPTKCIIKLIPKTSNPTAGYPSIKGISINGWSN